MKNTLLILILLPMFVTAGMAQLQSDESDAVFSIVMPLADAQNIDMGQEILQRTKSKMVTAFIENTGQWPIRIDTIYIDGGDAGDFDIVEYFPFTIPVGDSKTCEFIFTPTQAGQRNSEITIHTQADTLKYTITGEGVDNHLEVYAGVLDFGKVRIMDDSLRTEFLIENKSVIAVTIDSLAMLGPDIEQFETVNQTGPFTISAQGKKELTLRFAPDYVGRTSGRLGFYYDGPGSPAIVDLFGEGTGFPLIETEEGVFPDILCEDYSIGEIVIRNTGTAELIISDAQFQGADASEFEFQETFAPYEIEEDTDDTLRVLFKPNSSGIKNAELILNNDSENEPLVTLNLSAKKDSSGFILSDNSVEFTINQENTASQMTIQITNTGTTPISWDDPVDINEFRIETITPNPTPAGESSDVEVHFLGAPVGTYSRTYDFKDSCGRTNTLSLNAEVTYAPPASLSIKAGSVEAYPGEELNIPITLNSEENLAFTGISGISTELLFNRTVLLPKNIQLEIVDNNIGKVSLNDVPLIGNPGDTLAIVTFIAALGNADEFDLILSDFETIGGTADINLINGKFKLLGVCPEGGKRLLNMENSKAGFLSIQPNPAQENIEISYSLSERGNTEIILCNILGQKVKTVLSENASSFGEFKKAVSIYNLSDGNYYIIFKTPTVFETRSVMIVK